MNALLNAKPILLVNKYTLKQTACANFMPTSSSASRLKMSRIAYIGFSLLGIRSADINVSLLDAERGAGVDNRKGAATATDSES